MVGSAVVAGGEEDAGVALAAQGGRVDRQVQDALADALRGDQARTGGCPASGRGLRGTGLRGAGLRGTGLRGAGLRGTGLRRGGEERCGGQRGQRGERATAVRHRSFSFAALRYGAERGTVRAQLKL
ncbi:hypothetical protein SVIO_062040 [Streptomyces violaceusniger]|uniref:Uncharacterized protein n=1 Tax=Streptomyces violaceusniger TaxID=68280 RepID=A0A4D4L1V1_STRVO|nr:hypothetical protein SVIO_062040 [Streptomyces violaceusniger]